MKNRMNKHTTDVVSYLTFVGLLLAFVAGDPYSRFHINQSLVIWITSTVVGLLGRLPLVGGLIGFVGGIYCLICWAMGFYYAISGQEKEVPGIGSLHLLG